MKKTVLPALAGILLCSALAAQAEELSQVDNQIKYRQATWTLVRTYFAPMGAMAQGKMPFDKARVAQYADVIATLSKLPMDPFPPGSEKGDKVKTAAKAEIWMDNAKFKERFTAFQQESGKLAQLARSGDEKAIKAQIGAVGKTCKACHDDFREK
jgi:cytochrome c556